MPLVVKLRYFSRAAARAICSARYCCRSAASFSAVATIAAGAVRGVPASNGGCGSYSTESWIACAT